MTRTYRLNNPLAYKKTSKNLMHMLLPLSSSLSNIKMWFIKGGIDSPPASKLFCLRNGFYKQTKFKISFPWWKPNNHKNKISIFAFYLQLMKSQFWYFHTYLDLFAKHHLPLSQYLLSLRKEEMSLKFPFQLICGISLKHPHIHDFLIAPHIANSRYLIHHRWQLKCGKNPGHSTRHIITKWSTQ